MNKSLDWELTRTRGKTVKLNKRQLVQANTLDYTLKLLVATRDKAEIAKLYKSINYMIISQNWLDMEPKLDLFAMMVVGYAITYDNACKKIFWGCIKSVYEEYKEYSKHYADYFSCSMSAIVLKRFSSRPVEKQAEMVFRETFADGFYNESRSNAIGRYKDGMDTEQTFGVVDLIGSLYLNEMLKTVYISTCIAICSEGTNIYDNYLAVRLFGYLDVGIDIALLSQDSPNEIDEIKKSFNRIVSQMFLLPRRKFMPSKLKSMAREVCAKKKDHDF